MNSLVKVFSNFKEFYSEINGATLTGAIDVIVVEQPDGEFQCSPFHVRFGKLGVLRSREKVVDIEINGEPVDIHMKLGESGEAFFVEECPEEDIKELPDNLATSPIPSNYINKFANESLDDETYDPKSKNASEDIKLPLPLPRRNSIDFSKDATKEEIAPKFENQISDFSHRRHTDNTLERRSLNEKLKEYTTQKIRQEWAEHEEIFNFDAAEKDKDWGNSTQAEEKSQKEKITAPEETIKAAAVVETSSTKEDLSASTGATNNVESAEQNSNQSSIKDDGKGKKKRRKKSQMKKKNAQRKSSSSSSVGSIATQDGGSLTAGVGNANGDEGDGISLSISNTNNSSSNEELTPKSNDLKDSANLRSIAGASDGVDNAKSITVPLTPTNRHLDLDIHFFSDTEVTVSGSNGPCGSGRGAGRPSTPIQSDSELEISMREKDADVELMSSSASWKWGELPTPEHSEQKNGSGVGKEAQAQAQRNSMLSGMFNFMKKTNKMRKQANDGGMYLSDLDAEGVDPEMAAMYFPTNTPRSKDTTPIPNTLHVAGEDDRESGNGTSLPHSPSSMEGQKSLDSDYEENGKPGDAKYLDFVAMSLCGVSDKGEPSDEEFDRHMIKYSDVCENPSLFASPNLIVRLNGRYFSWVAACPIVMTIITFQKPLSNDAIEQLMANAKQEDIGRQKESIDGSAATGGQAKRSWWYWRRSAGAGQSVNSDAKTAKSDGLDDKDADQSAVATQTTRPNSPDVSDNTLSKTDSTLNAENTSAMVETMEDMSMATSRSQPYTIANVSITPNTSSKDEPIASVKNFKKSLRLSSDAIKLLNLKDGMNEIEFSVTTAYQGTTRCKCYLFRWKHSDKVVISDIDGTITKSDVLGHLLPMVGKDWAQLGVAQLFSKIEQNGYKLLYLSARAIGQSRATREYLRSIRQGNTKLPDGPLLLNPTSLISAFHREVIERKPEQFKIACLSDIRELFPDKNPFYAGYGNRINDVWAYGAVGIPIMRIFTINTKGELKHELTQTFQSSYCSMTYIVDQLFPPIKADEGSIEFSNFNYWRDPIADIDLDLTHVVSGGGAAAAITSDNHNAVDLSKPLCTIPEN